MGSGAGERIVLPGVQEEAVPARIGTRKQESAASPRGPHNPSVKPYFGSPSVSGPASRAISI